MSKRKWQKHCLRVNIAQPEDLRMTRKVKVSRICSSVLNDRDKEPTLYDAIKDVAPYWWGEDTQITLNKDLAQETQGTCQQGALLDPHRRSTKLRQRR